MSAQTQYVADYINAYVPWYAFLKYKTGCYYESIESLKLRFSNTVQVK